MARGDGIHRTSARNARMKDADIGNAQAHNEREKSSYVNQDIPPLPSAIVWDTKVWKSPTGTRTCFLLCRRKWQIN